jgi:translocation and assembly module TamA
MHESARRYRHNACLLACLTLGGWIGVIAPNPSWAQQTNTEAERANLKVIIEGIGRELANNVRAYLSIEAAKTDTLTDAAVKLFGGARTRGDSTLSDAEVHDLHRKAAKEIPLALQPFGFYSPKVDAALTKEDGIWVATYRIDPGAPVTLRTVQLTASGPGQDDEELAKARDKFPLKAGDVLRHAVYEAGKSTLLRNALNAGYLDARWEKSEVQVSRNERSADIILTLATGKRYRFGTVTYVPPDIIAPHYLERYTDFAAGDPYSPAKLVDLQTALYDTDYFQSAVMTPRRDQSQGDELPVEVQLAPKARNRYTAGAGYSTDSGARASLGWIVRRVNERGDRFNSRLRWSQVKQSADVAYIIPGAKPRRERIELLAGWSDSFIDGRAEEQYVTSLSKTVVMANDVIRNMYVKLSRERYKLGHEDQGSSKLAMPGIRFSKITADSAAYPLAGLRWSIDVRGAREGFISDSSFVQALLSAKVVRGLWSGARVLLRSDIGASQLSPLGELPPSVRFYAGGDQSVRGYGYESLSPDGIGGTQLLVGSVELEQTLAGKWSAAVFTDAGNAMNSWGEDLAQGSGIGLHWRSPIGPVRVEYAWAVSEPGRPGRWHITVGPDL